MTTQKHETVLIAPDGCTSYLKSSIDRYFAKAQVGDELLLHFEDADAKYQTAEWCLQSGWQINNLFAHYTDSTLLVGHGRGG